MEGDRVPCNYNDMSVDPGRKAYSELMQGEGYFMVPQSSLTNQNYKNIRRYAVRFIEKQSKATPPNFDALVPYMAMTYFDRFVSRGGTILRVFTIDLGSRNLDLFLTCCLILAWKLRSKIFKLEWFLEDRNLLRDYPIKKVFEMEMCICKRLEWRMRTLTPFSFLEYYISILRVPPDSPSPRRPVCQLIVKSQFDIAFTEYRPSILAASAMLIVTSKMFPIHYYTFERDMMSSEFLRPLKDVIRKCKQALAPLCKDPFVPGSTDISIPIDEPAAAEEGTSSGKRKLEEAGPGEASRSVIGRRPSDPIPIATTPAQARIKQREMSELRDSVPDETDDEEEKIQSRLAGVEPAATDFSIPIRAGPGSAEKKPAGPKDVPGEASGSIETKLMAPKATRPTTCAAVEALIDQGEMPNWLDTMPAEKDIEEARKLHNQHAGKEPESMDSCIIVDDTATREGPSSTEPTAELGEASSSTVAEISESAVEWSRRPGKEPAASEIEEVPEPIRRILVPCDDNDEMMNFELGWLKAQEEADARDGVPVGDGGTNAVQMVGQCCTNLVKNCNIL